MAKKNLIRLHLTAPSGRADDSNRLLKRATSGAALVTLSLLAATLVVSTSLAAAGGNEAALNIEVQKLSAENTNISSGLAIQSSINNIYKEATALGFVPPSKVVRIDQTSSVALKQ